MHYEKLATLSCWNMFFLLERGNYRELLERVTEEGYIIDLKQHQVMKTIITVLPFFK